MVKTKAPAISIDARGSLADTVSFGSWKGRTYLRKKALPKQPNSGEQIGYRAIFKWLTQRWPNISAANRATWNDAAAADDMDPSAWFLRFNIENWTTELCPADIYPATRTVSGTSFAFAFPKVDAAENAAFIQIRFNNNEGTYGCYVYRDTSTPMTIDNAHVITIMNVDGTLISKYYDRNLAPGTYYYRFRPYNETGFKWNAIRERSVVIS